MEKFYVNVEEFRRDQYSSEEEEVMLEEAEENEIDDVYSECEFCQECSSTASLAGRKSRSTYSHLIPSVQQPKQQQLLQSNDAEHCSATRHMFPDPKVHVFSLERHPSIMSIATICNPSLLNMSALSKKPIICPHYDCHKTIAVSALDVHFQHEHKRVPAICTNVEQCNRLTFNFADLRMLRTRNVCIGILSLKENDGYGTSMYNVTSSIYSEKTSDSHVSRLLAQQNNKPIFILIAARIPRANTTNLNAHEDGLISESTTGTVGGGSDGSGGSGCVTGDITAAASDGNENGFPSNERVVVYLTSNILANYSYTIAISSDAQKNRVKYYGPLLSVNEDLQQLCDDGRGLVLNHSQINGMSACCTESVHFDLIIHQQEEELHNADMVTIPSSGV